MENVPFIKYWSENINILNIGQSGGWMGLRTKKNWDVTQFFIHSHFSPTRQRRNSLQKKMFQGEGRGCNPEHYLEGVSTIWNKDFWRKKPSMVTEFFFLNCLVDGQTPVKRKITKKLSSLPDRPLVKTAKKKILKTTKTNQKV